MATKKYDNLAEEIIRLVGGKENVSGFLHCITRLRFNLKDKGLVEDEKMKQLAGIVGAQWSGEQYQIIIGTDVDRVYKTICDKYDFQVQGKINENVDDVKEKGIKGIGNRILNVLSGCLTPIIPMFIVSAMFKTLIAVFGPNLLNVLQETSDLYVLFTFVGDAAFYFMPVAVAYTAAKKFDLNPIMGILMGAILIHPTLINLATEGASFSVYGIPCLVQNYSSTIIPSILSVWIMSYVDRFFNTYIPSSLKVVFAPFLTMLVMLPLALCVFGPAGHFLGEYISNFFLMMGESGGIAKILGIALIAGLWQFLVMTGMHWLLIATSMVVVAEAGQESFVLATCCAAFTVGGMCLGAFFRLRKTENKSLAFSYVIAQLIGGITEPGLYGVGFRYKKPMIGMVIGGFCGGLYAGVTQLTAYQALPVGNFLSVLDYVGGSTGNFINGIIAAMIAFVVAGVVTYVVGLEENAA